MVDYKLIAFDVDGTILQGFDFSWKLVWAYLGYDDSLRMQGVKDFLCGKITYEQWNYYCIEHFIAKKLKREDFNKICSGIRIAKNLKKTILELKKRGFKTAIISGGISTFLEEVIPDFKDYFDYVFINEFEYDSENFLAGVKPTLYDFEKKVDGLNFICIKENIKLKDTVFVGDNINDSIVVRRAGLGISVDKSNCDIAKSMSDYVIGEDMYDIIRILDRQKVIDATRTGL